MVTAMKNILLLLTVVLTVFTLILQVWAVPAVDPAQRIYDYADLLTDEEEASLKEQASSIAEEYEMDVAIVLTDKIEGLSSAAYADDFYDYNDFGCGEGDDGLLMLVNMADREIWITTYGTAISYFPDDKIDDITESVAMYLGDGAYYKASKIFLSETEDTVRKDPTGTTTDFQVEPSAVKPAPPQTAKERWSELLGMATMGATVIASIVTSIVIASHGKLSSGGKPTAAYVGDSRLHLTNRRDIFINSTMKRTKIPKDPPSGSSGGGSRGVSTTHTSSSGRAHGGGGRKF